MPKNRTPDPAIIPPHLFYELYHDRFQLKRPQVAKILMISVSAVRAKETSPNGLTDEEWERFLLALDAIVERRLAIGKHIEAITAATRDL